jgi:hypothetical protein
MSVIEDTVLGELRKQPELKPTERGFVWERGEDVSRIWFQPTTVRADQFGLCATAFIETTFGPRIPALPEKELARLNRWACFGSFFSENDHLGIGASYCIYEKEPASWVAIALLRAMGEQLALGVGTIHSELVPKALPGNRANLEYPRRWAQQPDPSVFDAMAERLRAHGLVATRGPHGLVLEVPLGGGSPSRMFNPKSETALLHVSMDVPHPLAGIGYLATVTLPYDPPSGEIPFWCKLLNSAEHGMQDFVPRLGAWGMRSLDSELVYSMFWPTDRAENTLAGTIMNWMIQRTFWIRKHYWTAGKGLALQESTDV